MTMSERNYHIGLNLPEPEALAVSRLAQAELRDLKSQVRYLLRTKLIELGALVEDTPQTMQTTLKIQS
jgi:hypothetical protein